MCSLEQNRHDSPCSAGPLEPPAPVTVPKPVVPPSLPLKYVVFVVPQPADQISVSGPSQYSNTPSAAVRSARSSATVREDGTGLPSASISVTSSGLLLRHPTRATGQDSPAASAVRRAAHCSSSVAITCRPSGPP